MDKDIENDGIVIRKLLKKPREGWTEFSKTIAAVGDDQLVIPEFANEADVELVW